MTKANAKIQSGLLAQSSPVLADLAGRNQLKIVAAFYDVGNGTVSLVE